MRLSLYLFGATAAAAGTLASTLKATTGDRIAARDYLQNQIDAMNDASNCYINLKQQMTNWDGNNWNQLNTICSKQDDLANKINAAAKSFVSLPSLTVDEQDDLTTAANDLYQNMLDYARFMENNLSKWQRWRDNDRNDKTARTKLDAVKKASDQWMYEFFVAIPKERWDVALGEFKLYDQTFMDARSVYQ